jgi:membrane-bound lytic murein transglycosylase A
LGLVKMKKTLALLAIALGAIVALPLEPAHTQTGQRSRSRAPRQERTTIPDAQKLGIDEQLWGKSGQPADRQALLKSIDYSLRYLKTPHAIASYKQYPVPGITHDRVVRSLQRFRELVETSNSPEELQAATIAEFDFYQAIGKDGKGSVLYTGYYEPVYRASIKRTEEYRYPLYQIPPDFSNWPKPHPSRAQLEGKDGLLGDASPLKGLELVWLRDRFEAFLVQIQGSARLQLTDGSTMSVGFAGGTDHPFTSVGRLLAKDGKLPLEGMSLQVMTNYFQKHPEDLSKYIPRNQRFVFFYNTQGAPTQGVIKVPVTPERSIATDRTLMPPGALALVHTRLPYLNGNGKIEQRLVSRYVLDQDTGSAIKGPGRVDYYFGTGKRAGDRAGTTGGTGQLYYLVLKE